MNHWDGKKCRQLGATTSCEEHDQKLMVCAELRWNDLHAANLQNGDLNIKILQLEAAWKEADAERHVAQAELARMKEAGGAVHKVANDLADERDRLLRLIHEKDEWIHALEVRIDTMTGMMAEAGLVVLKEPLKRDVSSPKLGPGCCGWPNCGGVSKGCTCGCHQHG